MLRIRAGIAPAMSRDPRGNVEAGPLRARPFSLRPENCNKFDYSRTTSRSPCQNSRFDTFTLTLAASATEHVPDAGTQRDADAELTPALLHGIGQHAEDADHREQQPAPRFPLPTPAFARALSF